MINIYCATWIITEIWSPKRSTFQWNLLRSRKPALQRRLSSRSDTDRFEGVGQCEGPDPFCVTFKSCEARLRQFNASKRRLQGAPAAGVTTLSQVVHNMAFSTPSRDRGYNNGALSVDIGRIFARTNRLISPSYMALKHQTIVFDSSDWYRTGLHGIREYCCCYVSVLSVPEHGGIPLHSVLLPLPARLWADAWMHFVAPLVAARPD